MHVSSLPVGMYYFELVEHESLGSHKISLALAHCTLCGASVHMP